MSDITFTTDSTAQTASFSLTFAAPVPWYFPEPIVYPKHWHYAGLPATNTEIRMMHPSQRSLAIRAMNHERPIVPVPYSVFQRNALAAGIIARAELRALRGIR